MGITGSWNATTGELTLTRFRYAGTVPSRAAFNHLYQHQRQSIHGHSHRQLHVNDGDANSNTQTRDINITAVNDAPVEASIEGSALGYTENDGAVAITSTIAITDVDDTNIESQLFKSLATMQTDKMS